MPELHPQAPTGSQLYLAACYEKDHFIPYQRMYDFIRAKSISGFVAKRPRVRNENQDPSRQVIPGVNVEADLGNIKIDYMPDVDSIVRRRVHHNGSVHILPQLATTAGAGTITTNGTTAIVGVGSGFTVALIGQYISIPGEPKPIKVTAVADGTHLTLASAATTSAAGLTWKYAAFPVFSYLLHPRTPDEAKPSFYVDSMDFEASDGDGYPVRVYEAQQQDLEIKIADSKIHELTEAWMACYDTYASDAAVTKTAATFTERPFLFGHFTKENAAKLPLRLRITNAAGTGYDGKFKVALSRTLTGTVATAGTTAVVGTGTAFTTELAPGDELYIPGEPAPLFVATVTDATNIVLVSAAANTASGLTVTAATFPGPAVPFTFGLAEEIVSTDFPFGMGNSPSDSLFVTFPDGNGTVSVDDEWSFTEPRVLPTPNFSTRDVIHAASVRVTIDGVQYGGRPGFPGFHGITVKLTQPKKLNKTTGSKYAQGVQPNGRTMATISFDRDRTDRVFLNKLIAAASLSIDVLMYGNPFGSTGIPELWQMTFRTCEIADDQRDVSTENVLPEKIDVNATRGPIRDLSGTVATNGTTAIVGTGTAFDTEISYGDEILIDGETVRTVASITSATSLTLTAAASTTASGKTAKAVSPVWVEKIVCSRADVTLAAA